MSNRTVFILIIASLLYTNYGLASDKPITINKDLQLRGSLEYYYSYSKYRDATVSSLSLNKDSLKIGALYNPTSQVEIGSSLSYSWQRSYYYQPGASYGDFSGSDPINSVDSNESLAVDRLYLSLRDASDSLRFSIGRNPLGHTGFNSREYVSFSKVTDNSSVLTNYNVDGIAIAYRPAFLEATSGYLQTSYGNGFENKKLQYHYSVFGGEIAPPNSQALYGITPLYKANIFSASIVPVSTDSLKIWFNYINGRGIYSAPTSERLPAVFSYTDLLGNQQVAEANVLESINLGDMQWYAIGLDVHQQFSMCKIHAALEVAQSKSNPNYVPAPYLSVPTMLSYSFMGESDLTPKTGRAIYGMVDLELPSATTLGFEFSHGSKNWVPTTSDKYGVRGTMVEPYIQQEFLVNRSRCAVRLGLQHFEYSYTGSNQWWDTPIEISNQWWVTPTKISTIVQSSQWWVSSPTHSNTFYGNISVNF